MATDPRSLCVCPYILNSRRPTRLQRLRSLGRRAGPDPVLSAWRVADSGCLTHHRLSSADAHLEHHLCCQGHLLAKTVNNHKLPSVAKLPRADGQVGGWLYSKCTESECAAAAKAQLPTTAKGEAGQETLEASEDSHV